MESTSDSSSSRAASIARLIHDVLASRAAGREVPDEQVIQAHPRLMPELARELEKLRRIEAARKAAKPQPPAEQTVEAPHVSRVPGYSVLQELNRGGQGVVYLATQLSTGRKVAVKVLRDGPLADERKLARFQREVQVLAALNHPNIVTIIDTGQAADGSRYIVMNYIAGMDLGKYMLRRQQKDPDDPSKLLRMFLKICDAVNAAHQKGIVHRDLKPGNIRVDERGEPHVLDFGLARTALSQLPPDEQPLSVTGEFMGSLPWCSPEQAEGDPDKIDARTDVYSLGVILYQMLTGGQFPYAVVGNIRDVLNNILTAAPTPPSKVIAKAARDAPADQRKPRLHPSTVNETIERIVLKALSKERQKRYQTAGDFKRDITNYLLGRQPLAREAVPARAVRIGRWTGIAVLLGFLVLSGVAIFAILRNRSQTAQGPNPRTQNPAPILATVSGQSVPATANPVAAPLGQRNTVDLLKLLDLSRDTVNGEWTLTNAVLISSQTREACVEFPYIPPPEYDYQVEFNRSDGQGVISLICGAGDHQFCWSISALVNNWYGFTRIEGIGLGAQSTNPTNHGVANHVLNNQPYKTTVRVRKDHVEAYLDDRLMCYYSTDYHNLSQYLPALKRFDTLGISSNGNALRIVSAKVTEVSGRGRGLR